MGIPLNKKEIYSEPFLPLDQRVIGSGNMPPEVPIERSVGSF